MFIHKQCGQPEKMFCMTSLRKNRKAIYEFLLAEKASGG